jgi:hypothetical protein
VILQYQMPLLRLPTPSKIRPPSFSHNLIESEIGSASNLLCPACGLVGTTRTTLRRWASSSSWWLRLGGCRAKRTRVAPFRVAVVHGGPGAAGELWPVARRLAATCGVLEPMQTATSVDGQAEELRIAIESHADLPVVLIGHSWGAWLICILTRTIRASSVS